MKQRILTLASILSISSILYSGVLYTVGTGDMTGTVLDQNTGLRWLKCSLSEEGKPDTTPDCSEINEKYTWEEAITACESLDYAGKDNWRLPNIKELHSIVTSYQYKNPMINKKYFPDTMADPDNPSKSSIYWSSTTYNSKVNEPGDPLDNPENFAWRVDFTYGSISLSYKNADKEDGKGYLRCVTGPE